MLTALNKVSEDKNDNLDLKVLALQLTPGNQPNYVAILDAGTQLSVITRENGLQYTSSVIGLLIVDFTRSFNVIRPMTDDQVSDLAIELALSYWHYKLEDFAAFFHLCKREIYGKTLDRIDNGSIYRMLAAYEEQRGKQLYIYQIEPKQFEGPAERQAEEGNKVMTLAGSLRTTFGDMSEKNIKQINALDPKDPNSPNPYGK